MVPRPVIYSRSRRLLAYLRHNRDQLLVDATVLLAWLIGSTWLFRWLMFPQWAHYIVLFIGIFIYSKVTPNWERPYRSPE